MLFVSGEINKCDFRFCGTLLAIIYRTTIIECNWPTILDAAMLRLHCQKNFDFISADAHVASVWSVRTLQAKIKTWRWVACTIVCIDHLFQHDIAVSATRTSITFQVHFFFHGTRRACRCSVVSAHRKHCTPCSIRSKHRSARISARVIHNRFRGILRSHTSEHSGLIHKSIYSLSFPYGFCMWIAIY